jgi:protein TonB
MKKYLLLATLAFLSFHLVAQTNSPKKFTITDTNAVYTAIEVEPVPPGGAKKFYQYIDEHISYPAMEKAAHIQGRVILQFVVEKDGTLSDIRSMRAPSEGLAKEAISVVSTAGKWTPGRQGNTKLRVQFTMPVNFSLGN